MNYLESYRDWCTNSYFDEATRQELLDLKGKEAEIRDRFYRELEFGTGGLRGIIGAGTNRMNLYTVRKATQGLANFILKEGGAERGVAIAYDSRNMSPEFSLEAALCLCANHIKTYRFESLRPTPELSFAVRELGCIAGIVITASHNPAEYNGYKVYWEDGAQITYPKDKDIIEEVERVKTYSEVKTMSLKEAEQNGLYHVISEELDQRYLEELKKLVIHPEMIHEMGKELKIVYTPLHGTGNVLVRRVLSELGFEQVYVVPEQELPDGNFSTVKSPNPEDPAAFALALKLAKEKGAELVLATDPDADRLGVYAKDSKTGEYHSFTGNMSGMLICEYMLSQKRELGKIAKDGTLVRTVVTTKMADKVAKEYELRLIEVLTGFKYIGEQIKFFEQNKKNTYEFGFEESYGCLIGTYARDKDAVSAVMMLCEAAAYYKKKGLTLWDQMLQIYEKYGYFKEGLQTITLKGIEGSEKIRQMMEYLRNHTPEELAGFKVRAIKDYQKGTIRSALDGEIMPTELPKSNVLYLELTDDAWVCIRPSGTEPKIKFYMGVKGSEREEAETLLENLTNALMNLVKE